MNHVLVRTVITETAVAAGLPEKQVWGNPSESDNLTLKRPRLEVDILPETYTRTGRKLASARSDGRQTVKKEVYAARQEVTCHVLAEDEAWLTHFCRDFLEMLPRGINDEAGNYVKITASEATFSAPKAKRVGTAEIKILSRVDTLLLIVFTWRITTEIHKDLIKSLNIKPPLWGKGADNGEEN